MKVVNAFLHMQTIVGECDAYIEIGCINCVFNRFDEVTSRRAAKIRKFSAPFLRRFQVPVLDFANKDCQF